MPTDLVRPGRLTLECVDLNASLPNGLPYRPATAALVKQREARNWIDSPSSNCLTIGPVLRSTHPFYANTT